MRKNKSIKARVKKILENKNKNYQRKYFILSKIAETDILKSHLYETFCCFAKSLNSSNGVFPAEGALFTLYEKQLRDQKTCSPAIEVCKSKLIKEANMFYGSSVKSSNDVIGSLLESIDINNNKINAKLEETLIEAANRKTSILSESEYSEGNIVDLTKLFGEMPTPSRQDIANIQDEEFEDDDFEEFEDDKDQSSSTNKVDRTLDKMLTVFMPIVGGDPKSMSKKDLAEKLGFKGNGRYVKGQKSPVLSGWNKIELEIGKMLSPYGRSKGMSTVAQRKWWLIQCIKFCLLIEKQQGYFLGLSSEEKGRLKLNDEQTSAVQDVARERLRSGGPLSEAEIKRIIGNLHTVLIKGDYDLESSLITETDIMRVLMSASAKRPHKAKMFQHDLDVMYPLHDTRPDFEKVETLSDQDVDDTRSEVETSFAQKEKELQDLYRGEVDPETGEPLYADSDYIANTNMKKIDISKINSEVIDEPYEKMTIEDYIEYMKEINFALARLRELDEKIEEKKPNIFAAFDYDDQGNLNYNDIEEINLPEDALTDEEIKEYASLVQVLSGRKKIEMLSLDRRAIIYDEMYERGATPEEFMQFMKSFRLGDADKPQTYKDIARRSFGKFKGSPGARQYALKAWFKANYFSLNPKEKAEIYAQLGEKWFERLTVLDLITDEGFERQSNLRADRKSPKLSKFFDDLPRYMAPKVIERYFDVASDESLETKVQEKIHQVLLFTDSEKEFQDAINALQDNDVVVKRYAILNALFEGTSSFRIFATTMLKEFYNKNVWGSLESDLACAVRDYFKKYYPTAKIGASLKDGQKASDVKKDEGKDLFNPIIYLAMSRTGLPKEEAYSVEGTNLEDYQRQYFSGEINNKGDFKNKVMKYNAEMQGKGLYGIDSSPSNVVMFNKKDINLLLDDIFSPTGIIGKVRDTMRQMSARTSNDFFVFLTDYDEAALDEIIVNSLAMSNVIRRGADPMNIEIFNEVAKDSKEALEKYKKEFASQLRSDTFKEYLSDEYGYEPVDVKKKTKSKGIPSSMV